MEGSKSETVFESMNLNPQGFINTVINTVDDIVDDAVDFYDREASDILEIDGGSDNNKSRELSNGIELVRGKIHTDLDKSLESWEDYCLRNTFRVPEEFVLLPEMTDIDNEQRDIIIDSSYDLDSNEQLYSLWRKLDLARKRSVELNYELKSLERASFSKQQAARISEALELCNDSSVDEFKDMVKEASELRRGIDKLKTRRMKDVESRIVERMKKNHGKEFYATAPCDGKLEEGFGKFLGELRKM